MKKNEADFLKGHSLHFLQMAAKIDKCGIIHHPDGYGRRKGVCGDTVEIFVTVRDGRLQSVQFAADGCIHTHACCNALVYLAEGKTPAEAWRIVPDDVINYLETLPSDHVHCAELAVGAFYLALANFNDLEKNPWKKLYQDH